MPLTKIQPSGLDQTLNYSVNKITVSGVDVLNYAQSAFLQANTVYNVANTLSPEDTFARTQANAAYTQANTATTNAATADSKAVSAGSYANAAFIQANAVYNYANTLSPTDTYARSTANAAFIQANAAFAKANTGANTSLLVYQRVGSVIITIVSGLFTIYGRSANTTITVS